MKVAICPAFDARKPAMQDRQGGAGPLIVLHRSDPARNMARFYRVELTLDLFGGVLLLQEWGRMGRSGAARRSHFTSYEEAEQAMQRVYALKARRGYRAIAACY